MDAQNVEQAGVKRQLAFAEPTVVSSPPVVPSEPVRARVCQIVVASIEVGETEDEDASQYLPESQADRDKIEETIADELGDEVDVESLPPTEKEQVDTAKAEELRRLREFGVYKVVPAAEARGKKRIPTRWVIDHRASGEVRARVVAKGVAAFGSSSMMCSRRAAGTAQAGLWTT